MNLYFEISIDERQSVWYALYGIMMYTLGIILCFVPILLFPSNLPIVIVFKIPYIFLALVFFLQTLKAVSEFIKNHVIIRV